MGIAVWIASAVAAFAVARIVPSGRGRKWLGELMAALAAALVLGLVATALDFGGWNEPDWRAGLFALLGALAAAALARGATMSR